MESKGSLPHSQEHATCPILSQIDPVHSPQSHFSKTNFNIILPSTPQSLKWPALLMFPQQNLVCTSPLPIMLHALSISVMIWSPEWHLVSTKHKAPRYAVFSTPQLPRPLGPKHPPQHPILENPQPTFLLECEWPTLTNIQNNRKITVLYIFICIFLNIKQEDKRFCTELCKHFPNSIVSYSPVSILLWAFRNTVKFLRWGVVSISPNLLSGGTPLVGCPRLLI